MNSDQLSPSVGMSGQITRIMVLLSFLFSSPLFGGEFGSLNPDAPPETAQFSFIVGHWDCKIRFMGPDQSFSEGQATWTGYYVLDGWAIKDDWVSIQPDGSRSHGFNIRSFNTETGQWDNRWLPQGTLQWAYYESEQMGETMVMTGGEGIDARGAFVDRITFYNISEDSWSWRKDRSYDDGESWFEGVAFIEATRSTD